MVIFTCLIFSLVVGFYFEITALQLTKTSKNKIEQNLKFSLNELDQINYTPGLVSLGFSEQVKNTPGFKK